MIWREWAKGAENINDLLRCSHPEICPVCDQPLKPVEIHYVSRPNCMTPEAMAFYTAICPKCRTQYERFAPVDSVTVDANEERIIELEERVRVLEDTLSRLITHLRNARAPQIQEQRPSSTRTDNSDNADEFATRYKYLLQ